MEAQVEPGVALVRVAHPDGVAAISVQLSVSRVRVADKLEGERGRWPDGHKQLYREWRKLENFHFDSNNLN